MIVYSPSLDCDIDTTWISGEELEALMRDWDNPEWQSNAAPGVRNAVRWAISCNAEYNFPLS